jgi:hypothetical protein
MAGLVPASHVSGATMAFGTFAASCGESRTCDRFRRLQTDAVGIAVVAVGVHRKPDTRLLQHFRRARYFQHEWLQTTRGQGIMYLTVIASEAKQSSFVFPR